MGTINRAVAAARQKASHSRGAELPSSGGDQSQPQQRQDCKQPPWAEPEKRLQKRELGATESASGHFWATAQFRKDPCTWALTLRTGSVVGEPSHVQALMLSDCEHSQTEGAENPM